MNKKFEVIEDNSGGITLVVFGENKKAEYLHSGFEYVRDGLLKCLEGLKNGDNPVQDWDGNVENPQAVYDTITANEHGWKVVADSAGIYPDNMGTEALLQFKKKKIKSSWNLKKKKYPKKCSKKRKIA